MTPRQAALIELLQRADDDGLRRAHTLTREGHPQRFLRLTVQPCIYRTLQLLDREKDKLCD